MKPVLEKLSTALRYIGATGQAAQVKALVNMVMNMNTAALAEGLGVGRRARARSEHAARGVSPDGRELTGVENRRRGHAARGRTIAFFPRRTRRRTARSPGCLGSEAGLNLPLAGATKLQFDRMVALGLGHLDKSGVAELTFKGRHG